MPAAFSGTLRSDHIYIMSLPIFILVLFIALPLASPLYAEKQENQQVLLEKAKKGDGEAAFAYARALQQSGAAQRESNWQIIAFWLQRAAQQSNPDAAYNLASLYKTAKITSPSPKAAQNLFEYAYRYWRLAADNGDSSAMAKIGKIYLDGIFVSKEPANALHWLKKAIDTDNNSQAKYILGSSALWGDLPGYSQNEALELLQDAADMGHIEAWLHIGSAYSGAYGGYINYPRAIYAFQHAASLGNIEALYQLGIAYMLGLGVDQNKAKGVLLLKQAAQAHNPQAMYVLALAYRYGAGVKQNTSSYIHWLRKAADYTVAEACYLLGIAYRDGFGILPNPSLSRQYFKLAQQKNHVLAIKALTFTR